MYLISTGVGVDKILDNKGQLNAFQQSLHSFNSYVSLAITQTEPNPSPKLGLGDSETTVTYEPLKHGRASLGSLLCPLPGQP